MELALHLGKVSSSGDKLHLLITPVHRLLFLSIKLAGDFLIRTVFIFQAECVLMHMVSF